MILTQPETPTPAAAPSPTPEAPPPVSAARPTRPTRRRGILAVRATAGLLALGLALAAAEGLRRTAPQIGDVAAADLAPVLPTFQPLRTEIRRPIDGYGTAAAVRSAEVTARLDAVVASVPAGIDAGVAVEAGTPLAVLEDAEYVAAVERIDALVAEAEAEMAALTTESASLTERLTLERDDVQIARSDLERLEDIAARGSAASSRDVDRSRREVIRAEVQASATAERLDLIPSRRAALEARLAGLRAQRVEADRNLSRTRILSPIAGVLDSFELDPGESVIPGQRVARVVDPATVEIPLTLPAGARAVIGTGDRVEVVPTRRTRSKADPVVAAVDRIAPTDDPQTRTVKAYVVVEGAAASQTPPGAFVHGRVFAGAPEAWLLVPRRAIRGGRIQALVPASEPELRDAGLHRVRGIAVEPAFELNRSLPESGLPDDQWAALDPSAVDLGPDARLLVTASATLRDGALARPSLGP